ncbi:MAG: nuclease domain-containing protein [Pseudomonadota bacterium]
MSKVPNARPVRQKNPPLKSGAIRKSAAGEECTLRPPCCNWNTETTILAHLRFFGWAGTGQKPHDFLAIYVCSSCHDNLDGRSGAPLWTFEDLLRALGETLARLHQKGLLKIK